MASDSACPHGVHPQNMPRQVKHKIMNHLTSTGALRTPGQPSAKAKGKGQSVWGNKGQGKVASSSSSSSSSRPALPSLEDLDAVE